MIGWFRGRLGKPKAAKWVYVGHNDAKTNITDGGQTVRTLTHRVLFMMTDEGGRRLVEPDYAKHSTEAFAFEQHPETWVNRAWVKGGPFPKSFIAENDVLGDMLQRLIDQKITGEK